MYRTKRNGVVVVDGNLVGGHAILITGYDPAMIIDGKPCEVFRWRNSWGTGYGINGSGYILYSDLENLLQQSGEACVPMGRKIPVIKDPSRSEKPKTIFNLLCQLFCK
jgi:C1A family cysteine protease